MGSALAALCHAPNAYHKAGLLHHTHQTVFRWFVYMVQQCLQTLTLHAAARLGTELLGCNTQVLGFAALVPLQLLLPVYKYCGRPNAIETTT